MMTDKLQEICAQTRKDVDARKTATPFAAIDRAARENASVPRGFTRAIRDKMQGGGIALVCEIKKASPSAGLIRPDFDPPALAKAYEAGGAACLSVLTDAPYFQGCNDYLIAARKASTLPVLRKDFMIDVWQVAEARAIGADCILLIMAALSDAQAQELHEAAQSYGMDVLIETHDADEMERALRLPSGLIGINNRNLKTLKIDLQTTLTLAPHVPKDRIVVGESGIKSRADIDLLRTAGVSCFLIGESLMKQQDVVTAIWDLINYKR